jgi:gluconate 2-dehydrogenase gamma chain
MFDARQYATMRAVVECMIPADEAPGGLMAGVDHYLIRLLQGDAAGLLPTYQLACDALQQEAEIRFNQSFADLDQAQATSVLQAVERNELQAVWRVDAPAWVAMCAEHCAEGFYADPRQGGNHNMVAWHMIGFEERR